MKTIVTDTPFSYRKRGFCCLLIANLFVFICIILILNSIMCGRTQFFVTVLQEDGRKLLLKENTEFFCHENLIFLLPEVEQGYYLVFVNGIPHEKIVKNKYVFVYQGLSKADIKFTKRKITLEFVYYSKSFKLFGIKSQLFKIKI